MLRMCRVQSVAMRFQCGPRRIERFCGEGQVARDQRDLGLGDDASRASHGLSRPEGARRAFQESFRTGQVPEARHRDATKRERGRIVAQGNPFQCAEEITCGERTRRGRDQRVHRNPATLVTLTFRCPVLVYLTLTNQREGDRHG